MLFAFAVRVVQSRQSRSCRIVMAYSAHWSVLFYTHRSPRNVTRFAVWMCFCAYVLSIYYTFARDQWRSIFGYNIFTHARRRRASHFTHFEEPLWYRQQRNGKDREWRGDNRHLSAINLHYNCCETRRIYCDIDWRKSKPTIAIIFYSVFANIVRFNKLLYYITQLSVLSDNGGV